MIHLHQSNPRQLRDRLAWIFYVILTIGDYWDREYRNHEQNLAVWYNLL